jgi:hypothetical protein
MNRIVTLVLAVGVLWGAPAAAHVVMTDGPIGVTMHVDPDDAPVTGKPSRFYFWFKDTTGHLDPAQCRGTFTVAFGDRLVASQPLFAEVSSGLVSVHDVTFSKPGVYTVRVNGAPRGEMTFQPFLMTFTIRVTRADGDPSVLAGAGPAGWLGDHWLVLALGLLVAAGIVAWGLRPTSGSKKSK